MAESNGKMGNEIKGSKRTPEDQQQSNKGRVGRR